MANEVIGEFSVLSPSQKRELERKREEEEARQAAEKAEAARKSQEASRKAKEAAEKRKAEAARQKAEAEEKKQRRKALIAFLYILLVVTVVAWIYVSFHYFNWIGPAAPGSETSAEIVEGLLNMVWTGLFVLPIGMSILVKLGDMGWH